MEFEKDGYLLVDLELRQVFPISCELSAVSGSRLTQFKSQTTCDFFDGQRL